MPNLGSLPSRCLSGSAGAIPRSDSAWTAQDLWALVKHAPGGSGLPGAGGARTGTALWGQSWSAEHAGFSRPQASVYCVAAVLWMAAKFSVPQDHKLALPRRLKTLLLEMARRSAQERPSVAEAVKVAWQWGTGGIQGLGVPTRKGLLISRESRRWAGTARVSFVEGPSPQHCPQTTWPESGQGGPGASPDPCP